LKKYYHLLSPDLLMYTTGRAYAETIASNHELLADAKNAYNEVIARGHTRNLYAYCLEEIERSKNMDAQYVIMLMKLFRHLRFLNIDPFTDRLVECDRLGEPPNWRNVPENLGFLVPLAMLFYTRLRELGHYDILDNITSFESMHMDAVGEQYDERHGESDMFKEDAKKYISSEEFRGLPEFHCIGSLIELLGFKYMKEKQNNMEHT
jgi:hypothetical protein